MLKCLNDNQGKPFLSTLETIPGQVSSDNGNSYNRGNSGQLAGTWSELGNIAGPHEEIPMYISIINNVISAKCSSQKIF